MIEACAIVTQSVVCLLSVPKGSASNPARNEYIWSPPLEMRAMTNHWQMRVVDSNEIWNNNKWLAPIKIKSVKSVEKKSKILLLYFFFLVKSWLLKEIIYIFNPNTIIFWIIIFLIANTMYVSLCWIKHYLALTIVFFAFCINMIFYILYKFYNSKVNIYIYIYRIIINVCICIH